MLKTYEIMIKDGQVTWLDEQPKITSAHALITILEENSQEISAQKKLGGSQPDRKFMLDEICSSKGFYGILDEMLQSISLKTGELLGADRTTIFLLDEEKQQLWTILSRSVDLEIRINTDQGIAGEVATFKRIVNIPYDFFDDPRSEAAKINYEKTGYRTYNMLCLPLIGEDDKLVAVVQLLNKLKKDNNPSLSLDQRIDYSGFTRYDENLFADFAPSIRLTLESARYLRKAIKR